MTMNDIVITFDVDWAPDFVIANTAEMLIKSGSKATWFVTHDSEAIRNLAGHPNLFELGIHPNFMTGTTQGNNYHEVMSYLMNIVPRAKAVRTHGMFYSAAISRMFAVDFGLEVDSSTFLGEMPHIIPYEVFYGDRTLLRMPYFWSDDGEMSIKPCSSFQLRDRRFDTPGLKILCFHPIHVYLNSGNMDNYNKLKSTRDIRNCLQHEMDSFINRGIGASSLLKEIIASNSNPGGFKTLSEIASQWRSARKE